MNSLFVFGTMCIKKEMKDWFEKDASWYHWHVQPYSVAAGKIVANI